MCSTISAEMLGKKNTSFCAIYLMLAHLRIDQIGWWNWVWINYWKAFSLIIEGTTEKVLQSIMKLKLIYNKNFDFNQQKWILKVK
jgi:hypothetical protein